MSRQIESDLPESRRASARKRRRSYFGLDAADFLWGLDLIASKERVRQKRARMSLDKI